MALESWNRLALLAVQLNGICLSWRAHCSWVTVQSEMVVAWKGDKSKGCELAAVQQQVRHQGSSQSEIKLLEEFLMKVGDVGYSLCVFSAVWSEPLDVE